MDPPYYRTVPSSPEPDDDAVILPGEDDIIEDEMSPKVSTPQPQQIEEIEQPKSNAKEPDDDEETILRKKLLEKKMEKERERNGQRKTMATGEKQQPPVMKVKEHQQDIKKNSHSQSSSPSKRRERIVWKRNEGESSSGTSRPSAKRTTEDSSRTERHAKQSQLSSTSSAHNKREERKDDTRHHKRVEVKQKHPTQSASERHQSHRSEREERRRREERRDVRHQQQQQRPGKDEKKKRTREPSTSSDSGSTPSVGEKEKRTKSARREMVKEKEHTKGKLADPEPAEVVELPQMMEVDIVVEEKEVIVEETIQIQEQEESSQTAKPKKYSKFESSPEVSEGEEEKLKASQPAMANLPAYTASDFEDGDFPSDEEDVFKEQGGEEENGVPDDNLPENKEFNQLTEEEKAVISPDKLKHMEERYQRKLIAQLPVYYPGIFGCRSVVEYECLNKISEGTFGVVYRAQEKRTDEIVALKRLKMEKEHQGFPITSLREINMLLKCHHPNVINVREVVVGSSMDKIYMVMEYVEHDMKTLMELLKSRGKKWTTAQVKSLLQQLLRGVEHMHEEYVIHRDLKTSNLLFSHQGVLKIADFGLAREFGEPIKPYTPVVVTLWYRSPELLLGTKLYSTPVDLWSVGCIFGEFLKLDPFFPGRSEADQLQKIFKEVGTPNENIWPGCMNLPGMKTGVWADIPYNQLRKKFASELADDDGYELLNKLLALDPSKRLTAKEALNSKWFHKDPKPAPPSSFPTWPAKSEQNKKPPNEPSAPRKPVGGFTLKFDAPKF